MIKKSRSSRIAAAAFLLFLATPYSDSTLKAQSRTAAAETPDIDGIWFRSGGGCTPDGVTCPFVVAELPLKARTLGFREAFDEPLSPKYDCVPSVVPSLVADPYKFQIEQLADRVVITYEKDDVIRTVWMEGHGNPQPKVGDFYQQGHSRGWYEENQLVVETTKFTFDPVGLDDMSNLPSSTSKKVTERYWREGELMTVEVTTVDPLFLNAPIQFTWSFESSDEPLYLPYGCDPELSKEALEFLPPKYEDPDLVRITVSPYGEQPRD